MNVVLTAIYVSSCPTFVLYIYCLLLCAQQLFCSLMWINISLDRFHSPVDSCLPAIKAVIWKWPESLWHSKCIEITQHQSQCISNTLLYHHPLFAYISDSFANSILCSYKQRFKWKDTLCMHNAAQKSLFNTAVSGFPVQILFGIWKRCRRNSNQNSTATIKRQMTKQTLICWTWFDILVQSSA